ncbi:MAG: hydrolase 2, exosortase A system-associated [Gammaproteobacteria bacterium]|nr:hydrolase 2, exosortase A system-associated [Gammaproteobacteria bacterium]
MNIEKTVIETLQEVLQLAQCSALSADSRLLGGMAEFDSLAVASVIVGLEEKFGLEFDEEDIHAEIFTSVGTLCHFVDQQQNRNEKTLQATRPFFFSARSGKLFAMLHSASERSKRCILFVPPFAEEMNRSRDLMTATAVALNEKGIACCVFDLSGTGDSAGDFAAARWASWQSDLHDMVKMLRSEGFETIDLVAIRLGALLATEYTSAYAAEFNRIVVWDPVFDGARFLDQFLRIRSMAAMIEGKNETVKSLQQELNDGNSIEVGGYELHPQLALALRACDGQKKCDCGGTNLYWVGCREDPSANETAERIGCRLIRQVVTDYSAYWSTAESSAAPALIQATVDCLTS